MGGSLCVGRGGAARSASRRSRDPAPRGDGEIGDNCESNPRTDDCLTRHPALYTSGHSLRYIPPAPHPGAMIPLLSYHLTVFPRNFFAKLLKLLIFSPGMRNSGNISHRLY